MDAAAGLPHAITGVVARGRKLGRLLGFPTANIELHGAAPPVLGVYATVSQLQEGRILPGVSNVGMNPTTGLVAVRLEVHLFDFDEDIYGQTLITQLIDFLPPEAHFADLEAMVDQMRRDAAAARDIHRRAGLPSPALQGGV